MFEKLKFFIKKLKIKETEYNKLIYKASTYDKMFSCIKVDVNVESIYAKDGRGNKVLRFDSSRDCVVNLKVKDLFRAAGLTFDESVKFNIDTNMDIN